MIELLYYHGKSWVSKAIQWQSRSPISHIAMRRDDVTIEAWHKPLPFGKVQKNEGKLSPFVLHTPGTRIDVFTVPRLDEPGGEWIQGRAWSWALSQVGKKYDFRMVLRFVPRMSETKASADKWFCSELVTMAFTVGSYPLLERQSAAFVAPGALYISPLQDYVYSMECDSAGNVTQWVDEVLKSEDRAHKYQQIIVD